MAIYRCFIILLVVVFMLSCQRHTKVGTDVYTNQLINFRTEQIKTLISDPREPLTEATAKNVSFFKPDTAYKVNAQIVIAKDQKPFDMHTYSGEIQAYIKYADLIFSLNKHQINLEAYKSVKTLRIPGLNNKIFVPYKDLTNGESSYGGGRYIYLLDSDIIDDHITLDFNKSFNPYCAYADGFNCPIPPTANHLAINIPVGEKDFIK